MPNNALTGLGVSIGSQPKYALGGVAVALAFNTYTATRQNQGTYDKATSTLTVAAGAVIVSVRGEENTMMYSDDTKIAGGNRFPEHMLGLKLGGRNQALNDMAETFDLVRTTWVVKTMTEEYLVLGLANGLVASQNKSGAGAGSEGFNGFDVVLSGGEVTKALIIDKAQFDALAAKVTT